MSALLDFLSTDGLKFYYVWLVRLSENITVDSSIALEIARIAKLFTGISFSIVARNTALLIVSSTILKVRNAILLL